MQLTKLFKSSMVYSFGNILTKAVGFLLLPFYTHYLTSSEYGVIELLELFVNITSLVFGLGVIGTAMSRIYFTFDDIKDKNLVISSSIVIVIIISLMLACFGYILSPFASKLIFKTNQYEGLLKLSFATLLISSVVDICLVYLRILNKASLFVTISISQFIGMAALNIFFIGYKGLGVWGFVYSKLIVFSIIMFFILFTVLRDTGMKISFNIIKKISLFGAPLVGSAIAFFIIHFSDRFILQHYHNASDVGIYSVAYKFGFLITFIVGEPFGKIWNVSLYDHAKDANWKTNFANIYAYYVLALLIAWSFIAFFSNEIINVMVSGDFRKAVVLIPLLALAYVFRDMGDFFRQLMYLNNRTGLVSQISFICAFLNIVLSIILIKPYGAVGAMWATLLTWLVYAAILYFYSEREFKLTYRFGILSYFVLVVGLYGVSTSLKLSSYSLALCLHLLFFGLFVSAFIWGNYLSSEEKKRFSIQVSQTVKKLRRV
jgi:O-antigen/teichoic acid export membrane protein